MAKKQDIRALKLKMLNVIDKLKDESDWHVIFSEKLLTEADIHGEINHNAKTIVINPQKDSLHEAIATFIHECLHRTFPRYTECKVRKLEEAIAADLAPAEKQFIASILFAIASWEE